jgi:hypothetical protein
MIVAKSSDRYRDDLCELLCGFFKQAPGRVRQQQRRSGRRTCLHRHQTFRTAFLFSSSFYRLEAAAAFAFRAPQFPAIQSQFACSTPRLKSRDDPPPWRQTSRPYRSLPDIVHFRLSDETSFSSPFNRTPDRQRWSVLFLALRVHRFERAAQRAAHQVEF